MPSSITISIPKCQKLCKDTMKFMLAASAADAFKIQAEIKITDTTYAQGLARHYLCDVTQDVGVYEEQYVFIMQTFMHISRDDTQLEMRWNRDYHTLVADKLTLSSNEISDELPAQIRATKTSTGYNFDDTTTNKLLMYICVPEDVTRNLSEYRKKPLHTAITAVMKLLKSKSGSSLPPTLFEKFNAQYACLSIAKFFVAVSLRPEQASELITAHRLDAKHVVKLQKLKARSAKDRADDIDQIMSEDVLKEIGIIE